MKRFQPVRPSALASSWWRWRSASGKARQAATAALKRSRWASWARTPAVVDGRDVAADLVLAVADDAAVAVALAGELDDDLDRLAGLVLDGEDAAGVEVDLIGHGWWRSGEEAGAEDPDIQVDPALGPGVAGAVNAAGGAGAELEIHPGGGFAPAV